VVIAARDEEARLEGTLRQLLRQENVEFEIIVVDDRSVDRTPQILSALCVGDHRIKSIRIEKLPEGWLGKCHACHLGAQSATGNWILFTDGDVWLRNDVIFRALQVAEVENADHITLTGGTRLAGFLAKAWHLLFQVGISSWMRNVNADKPGSFLGIGAFNLVRTDSYRKCGGYEALKLTAVDDVKLGLLLHRSGARTRAFVGGDDAECEWSPNLRGMVKLVEKYYFATLNYNTAAAFLGIGLMGFFWTAAFSGFFSGTWAGFAAGLGLFSLAIPGALCAQRVGWTRWAGMVVPLIIPVVLYANLNSALVTLRNGGICWRDTFYSLETLRRGNVQ
jgi:glycosyltransferase involved in cell wall biosynthesis